jgi:2,3-bisphosphoglycerate-dependent phosphoglycerate mutase
MKRKNIFVVRHCKAEGQSAGARLTEEGCMQTKELADFFRDLEAERIISSPFLRAVQSIEAVAEQKELPIKEDSRLAERVLSSKPLPDWLDKLSATYDDIELTYEGGESSKEAMNRILKVVEEAAAGDAENIIIVTHGNIMSLLLHNYDKDFGFDQWKKLSNPDIFLLQLVGKEHHLERVWRNERD